MEPRPVLAVDDINLSDIEFWARPWGRFQNCAPESSLEAKPIETVILSAAHGSISNGAVSPGQETRGISKGLKQRGFSLTLDLDSGILETLRGVAPGVCV